MDIPSGVRMRDQTTKARDWPSATPLLYWPTSFEPRGIRTRVPSKPRTSRVTMARAKPGVSELIAVSSTAGITVPWGAIRDGSDRREAWVGSPDPPETRSENRSSSVSFSAAPVAGAEVEAAGWTAAPSRPALKSTTIAGARRRALGSIVAGAGAGGDAAVVVVSTGGGAPAAGGATARGAEG